MFRRHLTPAMGLAVTAMFFALGGTAFAVKTASPLLKCSVGSIRGIAVVTGGNGGMNNVTSAWSSNNALYDRKYNCGGGPVSVRRSDTGVYEIRFAGNGAVTAFGGGISDGSSVSATRNADGSFRVTIRGFVAPGNETTFGRMDAPFMVLLV